jgi:hypothetical protein
MAASNLAARTPFSAGELSRLALYADGDESMMEEALGLDSYMGRASLFAAEQKLCMRFLAVD